MLSHKVLNAQDSGNLSTYYGDAADDYYAKEGEAQVWQGKGAEALGLDGEINALRFADLLHGRINPGGASVRNSTRLDSKDRLGIDLTFSAPKSVSIQGLVGGDAAMVAAHDRAVARVLDHIETMAQARNKVGGKAVIEETGNLIVAKFRHETTRAQDPEIHTHAVVMNLTQRADGSWRALNNDPIVKSTKFLGALYRSELARELREQGYELRYGKDGTFELAAMTDDQVKAFSKRSVQIEAYLAERGLTRETATASQRQEAALATRDRKPKEMDRETLYAEWKARAAELNVGFAGASAVHLDPLLDDPTQAAMRLEAAKRAVTYAVNHMTEREAIITRRTLIDTALKHELGVMRIEDIDAAVAARIDSGALVAEDTLYKPTVNTAGNGSTRAELVAKLVSGGLTEEAADSRITRAIERKSLLPQEARFTTAIAVARETRVLAIEREGRNAVTPIMSRTAAELYFAATSLNDGQRQAATMILSTANRVTGVEGLAGTGKSFKLEVAKRAIEANGYEIRALAPYSSQVRALREIGLKANTVASFLKAKDKGLTERTIVVVDEAGTMPANDMAKLLRAVEASGARAVFVGDRAQTKAIQAGRPFDQLISAGMTLTRMDEIQRQKNPVLKEAVALAAVGKSKLSLEKVERVVEIKNPGERRAAIAAEYLALTPQDRAATLIVSGTNEARREINDHVRRGMGTEGTGKVFTFFVRRDTTQEERRHARNYAPGDVIQPEKDHPSGLKRHALYTVVGDGLMNMLTVKDDRGKEIAFNPRQAVLSVYEPERSELAAGDLVRITRNDAALDLANGDKFTVKLVSDKIVTLDNGKRLINLPADKGLHLDHAHATTIHSSQGLTSDRVLIDAETTSRTTAKDTFYVSLSRARFEAPVFTDNRSTLPAAISRLTIKTAALDLRRAPPTRGPTVGPKAPGIAAPGGSTGPSRSKGAPSAGKRPPSGPSIGH